MGFDHLPVGKCQSQRVLLPAGWRLPVFRFHPAVLDAAHEVKDEEAEQGDEEGEENLARARDEADGAGEPDAGTCGQSAHMPA